MHTKTMEGLVGARTNMDLLRTPFRVYKEARRKGDTGAMERAMGYVRDYAGKAEEYKAEADKGMKEDAEAAREKAEAEREKAIQERREKREEYEKRIEENNAKDAETVEIYEEGRVVRKENGNPDPGTSENDAPVRAKTDTTKTEPVIYSKTGESTHSQSETGVNISVSI